MHQAGKDIVTTLSSIFLYNSLFRIPFLGKRMERCFVAGKKRFTQQLLDWKAASRLRISADTNIDGQLSVEEVKAFLDTDHDGEVTKSEMISGLMAAGVDKADAERLAAAFDTDNNDAFSNDELSRFGVAVNKTEDDRRSTRSARSVTVAVSSSESNQLSNPLQRTASAASKLTKFVTIVITHTLNCSILFYSNETT